MDRIWCSKCGSEIKSLISNKASPLDTFYLDFEQELESNEVYCSYCAKEKTISSEYNIKTNIQLAHASFSDRLYFSPEIINYSPVELEIRPNRSDIVQIKLELLDTEDNLLFEHTLSGTTKEETAYIPPFSKNSVDFNWTYTEEGQQMSASPRVSKKYTGTNIISRFTLFGDVYPTKFNLNNPYSTKFRDIQTLIIENTI